MLCCKKNEAFLLLIYIAFIVAAAPARPAAALSDNVMGSTIFIP